MLKHKSGNNLWNAYKIEEKLLWKAYRNHQRSFERYHPDLLRPPLPQDWGFATPIQNSNRYYLRNGWSYGNLSNLAGTLTGSTEQNSIKNFGEKAAWAYPRALPKFCGYPLLSQEWANLLQLFLYAHSWDRSEEMPIKNFQKVAVGVLLGDSRKFWGHPHNTARSSFRSRRARSSCSQASDTTIDTRKGNVAAKSGIFYP